MTTRTTKTSTMKKTRNKLFSSIFCQIFGVNMVNDIGLFSFSDEESEEQDDESDDEGDDFDEDWEDEEEE